jgi:hypothetical protein
MSYDLNRYDKPNVVSGSHTSSVSDYYQDRARAEEQIRRKLGTAYFYLRPEEKEEYIRFYFRKAR